MARPAFLPFCPVKAKQSLVQKREDLDRRRASGVDGEAAKSELRGCWHSCPSWRRAWARRGSGRTFERRPETRRVQRVQRSRSEEELEAVKLQEECKTELPRLWGGRASTLAQLGRAAEPSRAFVAGSGRR